MITTFTVALALLVVYAVLPDPSGEVSRTDPERWADDVPRGGTGPALFEPPDGRIYTGAAVDQQPGDTVDVAWQKWDDWTRLMDGRPPVLSHTFEGFDTHFDYDFEVAEARRAVPLISWQTGDASPGTIARAGDTSTGKPTDQIILQNAKLSADYAKPVFLRVDQEMNAHWFQWSSYNADGTRRASGPEDFRNMWRRMAIIFDGGTVRDINARLAALGMPPLDADAKFPTWMNMPSTTDPNAYVEPATNVAFVFNPVDAPGIPDVSGNRWLDYYPGDEYVDWVGQTTYNTTWNATMEQRFKWLSAFYEEFSVKRGKPYMLGEWGLEPKANAGFGDNPGYINDMLRWAEAHPKVKALVYFSVNESKGDYRLSSYPESAKTLSAALQPDGYLNGPAPTPAPAPAPAPAPNVAPVAIANTYSVKEDTLLRGASVLRNDFDADGNALTTQRVRGTSKGKLTLRANGTFTYKPKANFSGTDSFTYKAFDGQAYSNVVKVTIKVKAQPN